MEQDNGHSQPEPVREEVTSSVPQDVATDIASDPVPQSEAVAQKSGANLKPWLILSFVLCFVAITGLLVVIVRKNSKKSDQSTTTTQQAIATTPTPSPSSIVQPSIQPRKTQRAASSLTWLDTPVELPDANYFTLDNDQLKKDGYDGFAVHYYQVGSTSDGGKVVVSVATGVFGGSSTALFIDVNGSVTVYALHSRSYFSSASNYEFSAPRGQTLRSDIDADVSTQLADLVVKNSYAYNDGQFIAAYEDQYPEAAKSLLSGGTGSTYGRSGERTFIGTLDGGVRLYRYTLSSNQSYSVRSYEIEMPDFRSYLFQIQTPLEQKTRTGNDPYSSTFTLSAGGTSPEYVQKGAGCGGGSDLIAVDDLSKRVTQIGTAANGEPVYGFSSNDDTVVSSFYSEYQEFMNNIGSDAYYADKKGLSVEQFRIKNVVIAVKDKLDNYHLYYQAGYFPSGGCGKPVIYLYPTHTSDVQVSVDADIRISEPAYASGWSVTAQPDGTIYDTRSGTTYGSLYWEGIGYEYPSDTASYGVIVDTAMVKTQIEADLRARGLHDQEIADFEAFWLPKMPSTPFVRLTWISTAQVDRLAPLHVTPSPDTVIRVFLDYEGLNVPYYLPQQPVDSVERTGFTVVEWGGLLQGGIH